MTVLPNQKSGQTLLLDLGANIGSNSYMLVQFSVMGSVAAEEILGIRNPRVSLLNIGIEKQKGFKEIRLTDEILNNTVSINYIGYLEANDLLTGKTDVIVCDGFIGNVMLKTMEGVIRFFFPLLKTYRKSQIFSWSSLPLPIRFCLPDKLTRKLSDFDPDQYNGAYLLGLNGTVIKSHGSANQKAFSFAIKQAVQAIQKKVSQQIASRLESVLFKSE
jgi:glycerol-3-phosphate acyltransferase PlsX